MQETRRPLTLEAWARNAGTTGQNAQVVTAHHWGAGEAGSGSQLLAPRTALQV